jgi:membrane-associated phospholipid phosphatase
MSPPRFALPGVVDVVAENDAFGREASFDGNVFSAMPSLHVGWSALAAYAAWLVLHDRHSRAALLVWVFPALMVVDVFATGNHYVLDVVGSAVLLATTIGAARGWARLRASLAR